MIGAAAASSWVNVSGEMCFMDSIFHSEQLNCTHGSFYITSMHCALIDFSFDEMEWKGYKYLYIYAVNDASTI